MHCSKERSLCTLQLGRDSLYIPAGGRCPVHRSGWCDSFYIVAGKRPQYITAGERFPVQCSREAAPCTLQQGDNAMYIARRRRFPAHCVGKRFLVHCNKDRFLIHVSKESCVVHCSRERILCTLQQGDDSIYIAAGRRFPLRVSRLTTPFTFQ